MSLLAGETACQLTRRATQIGTASRVLVPSSDALCS